MGGNYISDAEIHTFTKCIIILAKSLSTPSLFQQAGIEDVSIAPDQDQERMCHSRQTVQVLTSWLMDLPQPLIPENMQAWMVGQLLQPAQIQFGLLRSAFNHLHLASIGILRPLILFLQQYALRQVEYNKQLQLLAAWATPILFPLVAQHNSMRAQLAVSILVSQAMKVFVLELPTQKAASTAHHPQPALQPASPPPEPTASSQQKEPVSLMEQIFACEEAYHSDEAFQPLLSTLVSSVVSSLFDDSDDEDSDELNCERARVGVQQERPGEEQGRDPMVVDEQQEGCKRMRFLCPPGSLELEHDPNSTSEGSVSSGTRSAPLIDVGIPAPWNLLRVYSGKTARDLVNTPSHSHVKVSLCTVAQQAYSVASSTNPQGHNDRGSLGQPGQGLTGQQAAASLAALGMEEELSSCGPSPGSSSSSGGGGGPSIPDVACAFSCHHASRRLSHPQTRANNLCL